MLVHQQRRRARYLLLCMAIGTVGCRDTEPPPAFNRDLGSDGVLLLPTASVWHEPEIARGKADWYPFRDPSAQRAAGLSPRGSVQGETPGSPARKGGRIESELREMIDEYNDFVAEATVDELLDYYVEEQHATLKPLFESVKQLAEIYAMIRKELEAKLPDAKGRIDASLGFLEADADNRLPVESITVVSNTEATGKLAGGSIVQTCRFRLIDEDWYVEIPGLGAFANLKPMLDAGLTTYRGLLDGLRSGQLSAEAVLQQLELAAQMARALSGVTKGAEADAATEADGD